MPRRPSKRIVSSPTPPPSDPHSLYESPQYAELMVNPKQIPGPSLIPSPPRHRSPLEGRESVHWHSQRLGSVSFKSSRETSPRYEDVTQHGSISPPPSPELASPNNCDLDLRTMQSPTIPCMPAIPADWMSPMPISDIRTRHDNYYLEDGVVFLVDNILFKVPRYMLNQESEIFRHLYSSQFSPEGTGSAENDPIVLNDIQAGDFQRLLTLLYPKNIPESTSVIGIWTEAEWQSVLHLAVMWEMTQIRAFAIEKLSLCASSLKKIVLGRRYDIPRWIRAGFLDLCLREGPLTEEEGSLLDWKDLLKMSRAREMIRFKVISINRHQTWESTRYGDCLVFQTNRDSEIYTQNKMVHHILDEIFGLEDLADINLNARPSSRASLAF